MYAGKFALCTYRLVKWTPGAQLLRAKITKAQKDSQVINVFFSLLVSARGKAAGKMLVKWTPDGDANS